MDDLIAWLTQIWDEQEAGWKMQIQAEADGTRLSLRYFGYPFPEHMLARIAADRQIVADYKRLVIDDPLRRTDYFRGQRDALEYTVRHLAEAYADRPGFQEAWKP